MMTITAAYKYISMGEKNCKNCAYQTYLAVADHDHHVVDIGVDLIASVKDTTLVGVPSGGIDVDRQGTNGGNGVHHAQVVVVGQLDVAVDARHRQGLLGGGDGAGVVGACKSMFVVRLVNWKKRRVQENYNWSQLSNRTCVSFTWHTEATMHIQNIVPHITYRSKRHKSTGTPGRIPWSQSNTERPAQQWSPRTCRRHRSGHRWARTWPAAGWTGRTEDQWQGQRGTPQWRWRRTPSRSRSGPGPSQRTQHLRRSDTKL